jgi:hypothetical protein
MASYRIRRRSFLAGLGGAFGFEILLDNLEASAQGVDPPPRLLIAHWPGGTIPHYFVPTGTGTNYTASPILAPFDAPELRPHAISLFGLTHAGMADGGGGPHQAGLVRTATGASSPGARPNAPDDACAGGPSWDQILLRNVSALGRRDAEGSVIGRGYYSAIGSQPGAERSSGCLSYSHDTAVVSTSGGSFNEHRPNLATASPLIAYSDLFSGFMPGGSPDDARRALLMRKSVLDSALRELARVRELSPASEWVKIDLHAESIRKLEAQLTQIIDMGGTGCMLPPMPSGGVPLDVGQAIEAHASILRAAFACDLIRVATLQFAPAVHDPALSISDPSFFTGSPPADGTTERETFEALAARHVAWNERMASIIDQFRTQPDPLDPLGQSLLDRTVIPFVTEVPHCGHGLDPLPAFVFGGRALGLLGGQYRGFGTSARPHNDLWVTVAQAFLGSNPLQALSSEGFVKDGVAPIAGLWSPS